MSSNSTTSDRSQKPDKPSDDFPLFPHATGRWAKKIRGKLVYFGPWSDPWGAYQKYIDQRDDLHNGRVAKGGAGLTIRELLNAFLVSKRHLVDTSDMTRQSLQDYQQTCDNIRDAFGLGTPVSSITTRDFELLRARLAKRWGPVTLGNEIQRIRCVFNYAWKHDLVDKPVKFGDAFRKPSKKRLRLERAKKGPRMFEAAELRTILDGAGVQLKAMILLGINCGFGNRDCGTLPRSALDLSGGWVRFPRPKTGIDRRCPLWPETVEAIRAALDVRPEPDNRADAGLVFVTKYGQSWAKHGHEDENTKKMIGTTDDPITKEFGKLLKRPRCPKCGKLETSGAKQCGGCQWKPEGQEKWQTLHRKGLGFYALRHTFETIGGDAKDQVAVDAIMGHSCDDMASVYR